MIIECAESNLRTYKLFKTPFGINMCVDNPVCRARRCSFAECRFGVETGSYDNVEVGKRTCFVCKDCIEMHLML